MKANIEKEQRYNQSDVRSRDNILRGRTYNYRGQNRFGEKHRSDNLPYGQRNLPNYKPAQRFEKRNSESYSRRYNYPQSYPNYTAFCD